MFIIMYSYQSFVIFIIILEFILPKLIIKDFVQKFFKKIIFKQKIQIRC